MRFIYSLLITICTPAVLLYFAFRGLRDSAYFRGWGERFGYMTNAENHGGIVLHAASVGEFNAAKPLIKALLESFPGLPLTVTTLTPTAAERVKNDLGNRVFHSFVPLDLPGSVTRFIHRIQPRILIMMETEIWPNLYFQSHRRGIPLVIANARLSELSANRYHWLPGLIPKIMQNVSWVGAQSELDSKRLISIGAAPGRTQITGNLKFEVNIPEVLARKGVALRALWPQPRPVLIAGSTHDADEKVIIPVFTKLLTSFPDALLILVPRHPERFGRAAQTAKAAGLQVQLHSQGENCLSHTRCLIIDAMGELITYYACADVAFVGGSIGNQGGHNALEPAALGKPVIVGPNMQNAREITTKLLDCGAAMQIHNQQELQQALESLLMDQALRDRMGKAGLVLIEENKGALGLTMEAIGKHLA